MFKINKLYSVLKKSCSFLVEGSQKTEMTGKGETIYI